MSVQNIHCHVGIIQAALTQMEATTVSANVDSFTVQKWLNSHRDRDSAKVSVFDTPFSSLLLPLFTEISDHNNYVSNCSHKLKN